MQSMEGLPPSRGKMLLSLALNKSLQEKIHTAKQVARNNTSKHDKNEDPEYLPESSDDTDGCSEASQATFEEDVDELDASDLQENIEDLDGDQINLNDATNVAQSVITEILNNVCRNFTKQGEKRKRKYYDVPLSERKRLKEEDNKKKHNIKTACTIHCKKKCIAKISNERRIDINQLFWDMTTKERKTFMFISTQKSVTKRNTTGTAESRRKHTLKYTLKDSFGNVQSVCKKFYLSTLGFGSNDRVLRTVISNTDMEALSAREDRRGKHTPPNKINKEPVIEHIKSFNPIISHYRRAHAPNRKYLPSDINIRMMHSDFKDKQPDINCSYDYYRKVINELNISFTKLGHEECFACETFDQHAVKSGHNKTEDDADCIECVQYHSHLKRATESRHHYKADAENPGEACIYSADLQKVIMLPRCESLKEVIFCPRIVAYNESFVPVGTNQKELTPHAAIWHQAVAGRSKLDILSTFHAFFIKNRDQGHIVLWLDNCAAQNKNWSLLKFFIYLVNCPEVNLHTLEIKYFEPGHTFMSADSFHHQVELSMKKKNKIFDFEDFLNTVQAANSRKVHVINMEITKFLEWGEFTSQYKLNKIVPRPYLAEMVHVTFKRGSYSLEYRTSFAGESITLNFLNARVTKQGFPPLSFRNKPKCISQDKKDAILSELGQIIPQNRIRFWENLPVYSDEQADSETDD